MKKMLICLFTLLFFVPINVFGLSSDYDDVTSNIVGVKKEEGKVNLYLFKVNFESPFSLLFA